MFLFLQNQELVIAGLAAFIVFLLLLAFLFFMSTMYKRKQRESVLKLRQVQLEHDREILRTQLEIQEQTLKNISQEIHDNIGQMLSLVKLNLATADTNKKDALEEKLHDSHQLVSKAIHDLRSLSHSMNPDYVSQMGLIRSIEYELEMIRRAGTIKTSMDVTGQIYKLDAQEELILFRIAQETFNNIIKHANAGNISVEINYGVSRFLVKIADDGIGFDKDAGVGLGIRNMHNRAKLIGAEFSVNSATGRGTGVIIEIPKDNQNGITEK